jgi:hypothetical protein
VGLPILTDRFDPARLCVGDGDEPQRNLPPVMFQRHDISRIERQPRGRQAECSCLPPGPGFHQRAAAAPFSFLGRYRHREGLGGDPGRVHRDAPGLDEGGVVILVGAGDLPFSGLRQFGLLAARELDNVPFTTGDQIVGSEGDREDPSQTRTASPPSGDRLEALPEH